MGEGLVTLRSPTDAQATLARLLAEISSRGLTVFGTVDHVVAAQAVGLEMNPATVVAFGSPKSGTPLMRLAPTLAIDLPLKALVWDDDAGATWLTYNAPAWLAHRHALGPGAGRLITGMAEALAAIAGATVGTEAST